MLESKLNIEIRPDLFRNEALKGNILERCVKIPIGEYSIEWKDESIVGKINSLLVTETLVTNSDFVEWLNTISLTNRTGGTYLFLNVINTNSPIFLKDNTYQVKDGYEDHPVSGVNWYGSFLFAYSMGGRLLTELEWEYCATGGNSNWDYPWGNQEPSQEFANYGNMIGDTTPVRHYPCNSFGLFDMSGNLREWCMDYYHPNYKYASNPRNDEVITSEYRVVKGGCWDKTSSHLKCSLNAGKWARVGTVGIGFRIAFDKPYT